MEFEMYADVSVVNASGMLTLNEWRLMEKWCCDLQLNVQMIRIL